jgi:hypothetical protein
LQEYPSEFVYLYFRLDAAHQRARRNEIARKRKSVHGRRIPLATNRVGTRRRVYQPDGNGEG